VIELEVFLVALRAAGLQVGLLPGGGVALGEGAIGIPVGVLEMGKKGVPITTLVLD